MQTVKSINEFLESDLDAAWWSCTDAEYFAATEAVSSTDLRTYLKNPVKNWREQKDEEESDAMELGTLTHQAWLEPHRFANDWMVYDGIRRGKDWTNHLQTCKMAEKRPTVARLYGPAQNIAASVKKFISEFEGEKVPAVHLRKDIGSEKAVLWFDGEVLCRAKYDITSFGSLVCQIVDLKTIGESITKATTNIFRRGYHISAAHYLAGARAIMGQDADFLWLFAESKAPYRCEFIRPEMEVLELGSAERQRALDSMCLEEDQLSHRHKSVKTISVPSWVLTEGITWPY